MSLFLSWNLLIPFQFLAGRASGLVSTELRRLRRPGSGIRVKCAKFMLFYRIRTREVTGQENMTRRAPRKRLNRLIKCANSLLHPSDPQEFERSKSLLGSSTLRNRWHDVNLTGGRCECCPWGAVWSNHRSKTLPCAGRNPPPLSPTLSFLWELVPCHRLLSSPLL